MLEVEMEKKFLVGNRCQKEISKSKLVLFWNFSVNSFAMPRIKRKKQQKVQSNDLWIAAVSKYSREEIDADNKKKVICRLIELVDGKLKSLSSLVEGCKDKKLDFEVADIAVAPGLFATFETGKGTLQQVGDGIYEVFVGAHCLEPVIHMTFTEVQWMWQCMQHAETAEDVIAQKVDRKRLRALLKSGNNLSQLFFT